MKPDAAPALPSVTPGVIKSATDPSTRTALPASLGLLAPDPRRDARRDAGKKKTDPVDDEAVRRRLTYYLLLRVVVTTLLLGVAVTASFADPGTPTWGRFIFGLLAIIYGLTLLVALLLRRGSSPRALAAAQVACDCATATLMVHAGGGADSGFVFLFLLVIVGAAMVLPRRGTSLVTFAVSTTYVGVGIADGLGVLPLWPADARASLPFGLAVITLAKNLVFFAATAALSRRLADELERAGQRIAFQGARLDDLATLHADVVRSLPSGLLTLSRDGLVRSVNPAGEEILGVRASAIVGRLSAHALPELTAELRPELWEKERAHTSSTSERARPQRREIELRRPDGERRDLGLSMATIYDAAGVAVGNVLNFQDLTQLREMQGQVERTERLAAVGRLAAGVAHEIRNPLAAISGSVQLLSASVPADAESRDLMEIVSREVDRLNRLITELLDYARPRRLEKSPIEMSSMLAETVRVLENDRHLSPRPGRLRLISVEPLHVEGDASQLRQVLVNLLRNAAQATPDSDDIELSAEADGEFGLIRIRDHGPGVPAELRTKIFEPFFTTKPSGTGLGLAVVHRIVEEHGGRIEISDAAGGGALFTLRLPLRPASE